MARDLLSEDQLIAGLKTRLTAAFEKTIEGTGGKVNDVRVYGLGNNWTVFLDSEFAALRIFYKWRALNPRFGYSLNLHGWYVAVDQRGVQEGSGKENV